MIFKKYTLAILGLILSWNLFGCSCLSLFSGGKTELFQRFDFIAIVEVEQVFPFLPDSQWPNYGVTISTIHQFKGRTNDSLIVRSAHPYFSNLRTSCDILIKPGEQWLVFGMRHKYLSSGMCSMIRFRGLDQVSDWGEGSVHAMIDSLDDISQNSFHKTLLVGKLMTKYPDGSLESVECFQGFLRHGKVKRYYPDGSVYRTERFVKGKRAGRTIAYETNGRKREKIRFRKGTKHGTSLFYIRKKLRSKQQFEHGKLRYVRHFSHQGELEMEIKHTYDPDSEETLEYQSGHMIRRTIRTEDRSEYWEYDQFGKLLAHKVDS